MTMSIKNIWRIFSPFWLLGPIFDKELRVSSRRKRNYVLRFMYIALLSTILFFVWASIVHISGNNLFQASRMALIGQEIIMFIVWFQFCATQIITIIMLSTSISDEIYNKTLGLLMSTPINSFQIVMGKLLSKLLQLILLLVISLPLLAVVRIFGGVPWNFIISSLCLTLTTIIFIGTLSLFFSIFSHKAYVVIIETIITVIVIFVVVPFISIVLHEILDWDRIIHERTFIPAIFQANPYVQFFYNTDRLFSPNSRDAAHFFWYLNCGILAVASIVLIAISTILVRKVALRQATGQIYLSRKKKKRKKDSNVEYQESSTKIRKVKDPPVIWKELRTPMLGKHKKFAMVCIFLTLSLLIFIYWLCARERVLDDPDIHSVFVIAFLIIGTFFTIILTATGITTEKEARSWPILLMTTLDDRQILFGKYIGTIRRLIPVWILLFAHVIIFSLDVVINPLSVIQITILVLWIVTFLFCTGVYFSSCFKHTTTAVIVNFVFAATIWIFAPLLFFILDGFLHISGMQGFAEYYVDTNPFLHAVVIMGANTNTSASSYNWASFSANAFMSTAWMLACLAGYTFIGLIFAWRAKCRFRKNIF
ncbi:MAG: ABC transporter permease subunit [Sedimentisphaerales bacterium]|nr:ABC transporter permease subunit [Sedimentisphaerales bacterium]